MRNEYGNVLTREQVAQRLYQGCTLLWHHHFEIAPPRWDRVFYLKDDPGSENHILVVTTMSQTVSVNLDDVCLPPNPVL